MATNPCNRNNRLNMIVSCSCSLWIATLPSDRIGIPSRDVYIGIRWRELDDPGKRNCRGRGMKVHLGAEALRESCTRGGPRKGAESGEGAVSKGFLARH